MEGRNEHRLMKKSVRCADSKKVKRDKNEKDEKGINEGS